MKNTQRKSKRIYVKANERKSRLSLTLLLAGIVFLILLAAIALGTLTAYLFVKFASLGGGVEKIGFLAGLFLMAGVSLVIGFIISILLLKVSLKPINRLVNGLNSLAAGNFETRIEYRGVIGNHPTFNEITKSFNTLASELESTEMLRSDFVNNFSHEFKTPIVSIAGFAKILQSKEVNEEQKKQYLNAIEEESLRLSYMATNVLNMTKLENQSILSDVTRFNLSEQVRSAVLLLERSWDKKKIELILDFDEFLIEANEEMLKQVWINLIDNAIKFAPQYGTVKIDIEQSGELLRVSVCNTGEEIPEESIGKIFNKFYQADESHSSEGNGIGLAIVKKVVDLHSGRIDVKSKNGVTFFNVELPSVQSLK